jgi:hypothetical protein
VELEKEDFTDYILKYGNTKEQFVELCKESPFFKKAEPEVIKKDDKAEEINLFLASHSRYYEKLVKLHVLVIGKDMSPYIVPKKITINCPGGMKKCRGCPISLSGGSVTVEINNDEADILNMIDVNSASLLKLHLKRLGVFNCAAPTMVIDIAANVEALTVINDVEYVVDQKTDYTVTDVYYTGHGITTNATYELIGRIYPHPKTQKATILVHEAKPAKSSIEAFEMSNGMKKELSMFKVEEK